MKSDQSFTLRSFALRLPVCKGCEQTTQRADMRPNADFVTMRRLGGRVQRQVRRAFLVGREYTTATLLKWVYPRGRRTKNIWRVRQEARRYADVIGRVNPDGLVWRARNGRERVA